MEEKMTTDELNDFMSTFLGVQSKTEEKVEGNKPVENKDDNTNKKLIAVQYRDKLDKNLYQGRQYTYYTTLDVNIGDIVVCPTRYGAGIGRVCRLDVPEKEVESFKDALKVITEYVQEGV